jgi:hypoxanthine phosphoribosyltransferase
MMEMIMSTQSSSDVGGQDIAYKMQEIFDQADCLYSNDQVVEAIFGGQLLTRLSFPLQVDYLHASRYGDNIQGDVLDWRVQPFIDLKNRCVLIVDDILDEGKTLLEIMAYCKNQGANKVLTAVLTDKVHKRKATQNLKADFCGLKLEDRFVFGFGMDYQGYWRNAPGIYAVKGL